MKKIMNMKNFAILITILVAFSFILSCTAPLVEGEGEEEGYNATSVGDVFAVQGESEVLKAVSVPDHKYFRITRSGNNVVLKWRTYNESQFKIKYYGHTQVYPGTTYVVSVNNYSGEAQVVLDMAKLQATYGGSNCGYYIFDLFHYSSSTRLDRAEFDKRTIPNSRPGPMALTYTSSSRAYFKIDFTSIDEAEWPSAVGTMNRFVLLNDNLKPIYPTYVSGHTAEFSTYQVLDILSSGSVVEIGVMSNVNDAIQRQGKIDLSKALPPSMGSLSITYSGSQYVKSMNNPPVELRWGSVTRVMSNGGKYAKIRWGKYGTRIYETSLLKSLNNYKPVITLRICSSQNLAIYTEKNFTF